MASSDTSSQTPLLDRLYNPLLDRLYKAIEKLPIEQRVEILAAVWELCIGKPARQAAVKEQR